MQLCKICLQVVMDKISNSSVGIPPESCLTIAFPLESLHVGDIVEWRHADYTEHFHVVRRRVVVDTTSDPVLSRSIVEVRPRRQFCDSAAVESWVTGMTAMGWSLSLGHEQPGIDLPS